MNPKLFSFLLVVILFCSCNSKPSESAISKKIMQDYVCMETGQVESLKIIDQQDAETISDAKGYVYTVSGEVVWEEGCKEFGMGVPPGFRERFENKKVYLVNIDGEWR